jgi:hypothetical protein
MPCGKKGSDIKLRPIKERKDCVRIVIRKEQINALRPDTAGSLFAENIYMLTLTILLASVLTVELNPLQHFDSFFADRIAVNALH